MFADRETIESYRQRLGKAGRSPAEADAMLDEARTHTAEQLYTDLVSVPQFMLWFEPRYGRHTPAAILHDNLIRPKPNDGPLKSDTLSDSFFRDVMGGLDHPGLALLVAAVLPFPSGLLWGRQYGASLVSAAAGLWLVPAAVFVLIGLGVYRLSEALADRISPRRSRPTEVLLPPSPVG